MTVQIRHLATSQPDFEAAFQKVLHWSAETDTAIEDRVAAILAERDVVLLALRWHRSTHEMVLHGGDPAIADWQALGLSAA